jgi:hypothetical protein
MVPTCFDHTYGHLQGSLYHRSTIWIIIQLMYLLCTSLHILRTTVFNFWHCILIAVLFYYSTVSRNQRLCDFSLLSDLDKFNYTCILVITTLNVATWLAETCSWPLYNKITSMKRKCICFGLLICCFKDLI